MPNECLQCSKACGDAIFCPDCQAALLDRLRQQSGTRTGQDSGDALASHVVDISIADLNSVVETKNTSLLQRYFWRDHAARIHKQVVEPDAQVANQIAEDEEEVCGNLLAAGPTRPMVAITPSAESTARQRLQFMRRAFIVMVVLAVVAFAVDGGLLVLVTGVHHSSSSPIAAPPLLTLSPTVVHPDQVAQIHISHFPATSRVQVTRDIGEPARLDQGSPFVHLDAQGTADVRVLIDNTWGVGTHYIEAEDVDTHYTASSVVRVVSTGQERPPHLLINQYTVSLGSDYVGANTLQQIFLQNTGGGILSWLAKSDQPWLSFAPMQGLFSTRQPLTLAVSRAHLLPGDYQGTVTFYSNAGPAVRVQVSMAVRALPVHVGGVLSVAPAAVSFVTTDGGADPAEQELTISNPGTKLIHWSLAAQNPTYASDQNVPLSNKTRWLTAQPAAGDLAPGLTATIHVTTHSPTLLPGSYSSVLSFSSDADTLNTPQPVAVSLTIQQRCGPALSMTDFSLTGFSGQGQPVHQNVGVSLPATCVGKMAWHAFSLASWLSVSPDNGLLQEHDNTFSALSADSTHLQPGSYVSAVVFTSEQRTLTLPVQFTVFPRRATSGSQASPGTMHGGSVNSASSTPTAKSGAPTGKGSTTNSNGNARHDSSTTQTSGNAGLSASSTALSFTVERGQNTAVQTVTLMNAGSDPLVWQALSDTPELVSVTPGSGTLVGGQATQMMVQSTTFDLDVGSYTAHIFLSTSDSAGHTVSSSAQEITVTITVVASCTLQISPPSLHFTATLLNPDPGGQTLNLSTTGNCIGPVTWNASVDSASSSWLSLSTPIGTVNGNGIALSVTVSGQGSLVGLKQGVITFSATDGNGNTIAVPTRTVQILFTIAG